ncbi:MFS transporter [Pelolinea submarina]|uniref:DHA1 family multidrug resistance protein-like MFS transporter n=1 Tax=Pelolinea submarina TaxID=913107 RepID=A0A347ZS57_9CHLR|nr:MFS transporter [Pelolinea submarina]REG11297.1 DHA1 family multidrug resistance protein-like MFS transporter [Pelolinea submarina]BBB48138.1 MFS transporter, DHA1 family, multidrug resistance protein [Pelolinea submarina]
MQTSGRKSLFILSFTLLVVMLGYGIAMPMLPFYIEKFGVGGKEFGWMMASYSFMQLICAPIWGVLSDRFGRKPILAVGVLGYALAFFMFGLAKSFTVLFIARSLSGVLSSATTPTAMAFVGDNASPDDKPKSMGQLGAMIGLGVILGPLLGGLLSTDSLSLPFFVGAGLAFLAFLLVLILLPESRPEPSDAAKARTPFAGMLPQYRDVLRGPAGALLVLILIISFGLANLQNMIGLYAVDKLNADTTQVSAVWMVMGVTMIVVQGGMVGWLSKRVGENRLIRVSLLGGVLGFVLVAQAGSFVQLMGALAFIMLTLSLLSPSLNASISRYGGEHQGALMGVNNAMISLGRVLGPLWGGYLYDVNMNFAFYSGAVMLAIGWVVSVLSVRNDP